MPVYLDRAKADARTAKFLADLSARSAESLRRDKATEARFLAEMQAKNQAKFLLEREFNNMTPEHATMLAKAIDVQNQRRKFIQENLSDLPSTYSEMLPDTGNLSALHLAAQGIRQQFETEFLPLHKKFQEEEALRLDGERRVQVKAELLAKGYTEGEASFAAANRIGTSPVDRAADELLKTRKDQEVDRAVIAGSITPAEAVFAKGMNISA
jgi:hypothetical protein